MKKGLILQERDVELLEFLAEYKTITLDNTKYIYGTKTYQEKRICHLVKEKYLTRLTHREISLGKNGKNFLNEIGTNIKVHCRNPNNIERLKVISDIASFTNFSNTMSFIPSWYLKDKDCPTQDSRRYLGLLTFDHNFLTVYSVYGEKDEKYITSLYYDLKKEREFYNSIIFANDIEKILYYKKNFGFNDKHLYLIKYNDFNKRIIRNYDKIRTCMMDHLLKKHEVEFADFRYMDFLVDNELYIKICLFLDLNQLRNLHYFLDINTSYKNKMYFVCFKEDEKYLRYLIKNCNTLIIDKSTVEEYLEKDFIEFNGVKIDCVTE